jgi:hypothetical protein
MRDWVAWHSSYDDPASPLRARLDHVTFHLRRTLDQAPPGPVRLLSLCAGQGRDVLEVLPGHPRERDVVALLIEADSENAHLARQAATDAGLTQVLVREADAGVVANFADALPVDVLLLAGIFGNVGDADIKRTIDASPALCAPGATVIWTRHRRPPDLTGFILAWFASAGFDEVAFDEIDSQYLATVGVHRLARRSAGALPAAGQPLFRFGSHHADPGRLSAPDAILDDLDGSGS